MKRSRRVYKDISFFPKDFYLQLLISNVKVCSKQKKLVIILVYILEDQRRLILIYKLIKVYKESAATYVHEPLELCIICYTIYSSW